MPPTASIQLAAAAIWRHSTHLTHDETIDLATDVLTSALNPKITAVALWHMDQNTRNPEPRPWCEATPGEQEPYLETATEHRDAVIGGQWTGSQ